MVWNLGIHINIDWRNETHLKTIPYQLQLDIKKEKKNENSTPKENETN